MSSSKFTSPRSYVGVTAPTPPNIQRYNRRPLASDVNNFDVGDFWIVQMANPDQAQNELYVLVSVAANVATWLLLGGGPVGPILDVIIPGPSTISPDGLGNLYFTSAGSTVAITSSTANTINFEVTGGTGTHSFVTDNGTATESGSSITIAGGNGINTSATGPAHTVTINLTAPVTVPNGGTGLTAITAYDLIIGNGTSAVTLLAPSATSGVALISQGSSSNPAYGTVVVAGGGTGLTSITTHDLMIGNGTSAVTLLAPSATSGVPLISQGSSSNPAYGTAVVAGGGTGATTLTATSLLLGNGTSPVSALGVAINGQIPIGSTGLNPVLATITAGTGIGVANAAGSITISNTGSVLTTGSWTPVVTMSTPGSGISQSNGGAYFRIGSLVYAYCGITISNLNGASGTAQITGLPFPANANFDGFFQIGTGVSQTNGPLPWCRTISGQTYIDPQTGGFGQSAASMTDSNITASAQFSCWIWYGTNS